MNRDIPFAFSFPHSDLLICEFPEVAPVTNSEETEKNGHTEQKVTSVTSNFVVRKVSRMAQYIYQRVVRRKPVPFQPSLKNPSYLLCYVEEELECGHKVTIHLDGTETLTARARACHECSGFYGGLRLPQNGKKPNASILRSYERIKKQAGKSYWPVAFAAGCLFFMAGLVWFNRAHPLIFSPENNHTVVRVLRQYNDFDWQIQRVVDSVPQTPEVRHFDEKPTFEIGYTLTKLEVNDRGKFWSIKHIDPYFIALRDFTGWPIIPANCTNALGKPVVCDGKPQF